MLIARIGQNFALLIALAGAALTWTATPAIADEHYTTSVIRTPNSPVALTYCDYHDDPHFGVSTNLTNRSDRFLTEFEVRWTFFDHSDLAIGQTDTTYDVPSLPPADKYTHEQPISFSLSEPQSAIARVTCRLQMAKFEGGSVWRFGRGPWKGRLSPLTPVGASPQSPDSGERGAVFDAPASQNTPLGIDVTKTWNDVVGGQMFVHAALDVHGAVRDEYLQPGMLKLTMHLVDGSDKTYFALSQAAPTYQKLDAMSSTSTTQTAFEVDPKEDLGSLSKMLVPANAVVHAVATFLIGTDAVADRNANRNVTFSVTQP